MRLLLISNSTNYGSGYLDHCADEIKDFLGSIDVVLFVPYALQDYGGYTRKTHDRYAAMGVAISSIHEHTDPVRAVKTAKAIHVGGGNTFRLLKKLYELNLVEAIRERVRAGMPYIGASAGTNVATLSIRTTNDMPIVYPPTFDALDFVPFNINPHYLDPDPTSTHQGETREQRIREFLEENDKVVVGLREGSWLRIENGMVMLKGLKGARIFRRDREPEEYAPGSSLDFLLK
jgi:dipeptidase E